MFGENTIAQTSVYLDLHDVKDFYERAVITNNMSGAISNWSSAVEPVQNQTAAISDEDSNLIVFVHGINVDEDNWLMDIIVLQKIKPDTYMVWEMRYFLRQC
jgi:hypothetical protein